jgi:hypothetical protein
MHQKVNSGQINSLKIFLNGTLPDLAVKFKWQQVSSSSDMMLLNYGLKQKNPI